MARIKIADLPKDMKLSKEDMKNTSGGFFDIFFELKPGANQITDGTSNTLLPAVQK